MGCVLPGEKAGQNWRFGVGEEAADPTSRDNDSSAELTGPLLRSAGEDLLATAAGQRGGDEEREGRATGIRTE